MSVLSSINIITFAILSRSLINYHTQRCMRNEVKSNRYYIKSITQEKKVQKKKKSARIFSHSRVGWSKTSEKKVFNIYTHTERESFTVWVSRRDSLSEWKNFVSGWSRERWGRSNYRLVIWLCMSVMKPGIWIRVGIHFSQFSKTSHFQLAVPSPCRTLTNWARLEIRCTCHFYTTQSRTSSWRQKLEIWKFWLFASRKILNLKVVAHALNSVGVTTDQLLFLHDEIGDLKEMSKLDRLKIVLVDHNNVVPLLSDFTHNIIRVIDHHKYVEPSLLPESCETTIKLVGSCSSLVSQDWLSVFQN